MFIKVEEEEGEEREDRAGEGRWEGGTEGRRGRAAQIKKKKRGETE